MEPEGSFKGEEGGRKGRTREMGAWEGRSQHWWLGRWRNGPQSKGGGWPSESGKDKETDSRLLFNRSIMSYSLQPHGLQHTSFPVPSLSPRVCSNSCPLSQWCHPISVAPFSPRGSRRNTALPSPWLQPQWDSNLISIFQKLDIAAAATAMGWTPKRGQWCFLTSWPWLHSWFQRRLGKNYMAVASTAHTHLENISGRQFLFSNIQHVVRWTNMQKINHSMVQVAMGRPRGSLWVTPTNDRPPYPERVL